MPLESIETLPNTTDSQTSDNLQQFRLGGDTGSSSRPSSSSTELATKELVFSPIPGFDSFPKQAGSENPKQAGSENPKQAGSGNPKQADSGNPKQASSGNPKQAGSENPKQAGSENPKQADSGNPKQADSENPKQAGSENPKQAGSENPKQAGSGNPKQADSGNPKAVASEALSPPDAKPAQTALRVENGDSPKENSKPEKPAAPLAIDRLIKQLDSDDFEQREHASEALKSMGRAPVTSLQNALKEMSPEQQQRSKDILNHLNSPTELVKQLGSERDRKDALAELSKGGMPELFELRNFMAKADGSEEQRQTALKAGKELYKKLGLETDDKLQKGIILGNDGSEQANMEFDKAGRIDKLQIHDFFKNSHEDLTLSKTKDGTYLANGKKGLDGDGDDHITGIKATLTPDKLQISLSSGPDELLKIAMNRRNK